MRALVVGGDRHGEWVDGLPDGIHVWVDIRNALNFRIRSITNHITDRPGGRVIEAYRINLAVHPDLLGPQEPQVVSALLGNLAMNEFCRAHGEAQEIPKEPAGSDLVVP